MAETVIPPIPFILLAAFFFTRSSPHLYRWMEHQKVLGKILKKVESGEIKTTTQWIVISQLWVSILVAIIFVDTLFWGSILAIAGLLFSFVIYRLF